ncbi:DUF3103 family protein [Actinacidiphila rubida]|uniref:DUF3103 family protein n=1 Tax=Actinacidiphila rubida TaxID=310780 RepID=A0A1H8JDJ5_9ACTN|nr:DUF3103 family protein [Actinacidiphila rubida]SEN78874.1 Protein of unknown function [Actinacidiphila rubida]
MNTPLTRCGALALVVCAATVAALQGMTTVSAFPAAADQPVGRPAGTAASPASPASPAAVAAAASAVAATEARTARAVAASLADPGWRARVRSAALASHEVDLSALIAGDTAPAGRRLTSEVTAADRRIAEAKGLDKSIGSLLRLRLGTQAMAAELDPGNVPLVAAAITDDKAATVTGYDAHGRGHTLNARTAPRQAVYVVDIDVSKAAAAGMKLVSGTLNAAGVESDSVSGAAQATPRSAGAAHPADASGYWATKMDAVYLNDDEEPWVLGDAEIYSLVSGFGLDGTVRVDSVDMPYLDNDHHTYYPNQLIINWSNFKYDALDLVMMESDSGTNYQQLAIALADALLTITDQGAYQPLVDAILNAIPSAWYSNDDDYVDSWYTITEQESGTIHGARGNGWMTVEPYWVSAL